MATAGSQIDIKEIEFKDTKIEYLIKASDSGIKMTNVHVVSVSPLGDKSSLI